MEGSTLELNLTTAIPVSTVWQYGILFHFSMVYKVLLVEVWKELYIMRFSLTFFQVVISVSIKLFRVI